ncbi:MAG: hypothetical protein HRU28_17360, partial [Rhizobiales bacterium]|nr:hypothetical protein [Hyphomicrobiales bacterium]
MAKSTIITHFRIVGHDNASEEILKVRENLIKLEKQAKDTAIAAKDVNAAFRDAAGGGPKTANDKNALKQATNQSQQTIKHLDGIQKKENTAANKRGKKPRNVKGGLRSTM